MNDDVILFDTHCHIHEILGEDLGQDYSVPARWHKAGVFDADTVVADAHEAGVRYMVCVGCTPEDSALAVEFVSGKPDMWAAIGIHPHEATKYVADQTAQDAFAALAARPEVKAVGECGLDYYYEHSRREDQLQVLHFQLVLAKKHDLPLVFHVRDAFDDFWPVFDQYPGLRGIVHSFTADRKVLEQALQRDLFISLNGIMTFSKNDEQLAAAKAVPLEKLVLETDAPFLTPKPFRGTICEPKHVRLTAEFLADLRGEPLILLAERTTANARAIFGV